VRGTKFFCLEQHEQQTNSTSAVQFWNFYENLGIHVKCLNCGIFLPCLETKFWILWDSRTMFSTQGNWYQLDDASNS